MIRRIFACTAGMLLGWTSATSAQALPDSLLAQLRAGAASVSLVGARTSVPLVGQPTVPTVEVLVNGRGPFRFLVDLGSNVTIARKNVVQAANGRTLVRRERSDIAVFDTLRIGGAIFLSVVVGAYDTLDVDGVLGYNTLRHLSFTLDYPGRQFVLHRETLPPPNAGDVVAYRVEGRMPFVWVRFGVDSLLANLDTGASEWFTLPATHRDSVRWSEAPRPGPMLSNNQTGARQVLAGQARDTLAIGALRIPAPRLYVNADADTPWLGSASMQHATWTFDVVNQRLRVEVARTERR